MTLPKGSAAADDPLPGEDLRSDAVTTVEIRDARGAAVPVEQRNAADFPLAIGGPDADLPVAEDAGPLAHLGLADGDVFVQPAAERTVIWNGQAVDSSRWLGDGDVLRFGTSPRRGANVTTWITVEIRGGVLRLTIRDDGGRERTRPPLIAAPGGTQGVTTIEPIRFEPSSDLGGSRSRRIIGPFGLAVALLLLALIAAAGFLLTSRSVLIEIEPLPDRMGVEGGIVFELGGRHVLRPGSYLLQAEKAGYSPLAEDLEVTRDSRQTFRYRFEKLPGRLTIASPMVGAEVLIDGESRGVTPIDALELAPGEYRVTVRADRYRDFEAMVTVAGAGSEQTLEVELEARWAEVSFASEPAGARVRLDGEELGITPLTAEVLEGGHAYSLVLAGRKPHSGRLDVAAGEAQALPVALLRPADGNLVLTSEPAGATVSVAGAYRGETPLDLYLEPGREYQVSVSKAGHETVKRQVQVASGQSQQLAVTLTPQEGELQISIWPSDAELVVDGEARGNGNQKLRLSAVAHQIEVRKDGFVAHRQTVTPLPGVPQWVEVTLKPVGQAEREKQAAATPAVVESHDHELRLIEPGKLRMGASRREPGRRANEVLREVELTRAFYLSAHEVSNRQFRKFMAEHASGMIGGQTLELDGHPAVRVTWDEAAAYCNWLSEQEGLAPAYVNEGSRMKPAVPMTTGYRLPTEAEWAWAARFGGRAGGAQDQDREPRKYPWGRFLPVPAGAGNYADSSASGILPGVLSGYNDQYPVTAPVDSLEADARGFYHLGGNVAEWVHDLYAIRFAGSQELERDPLGPTEGQYHVIRGSSWMHSTVTELRLTYRDYGSEERPDVGFRIARYAE